MLLVEIIWDHTTGDSSIILLWLTITESDCVLFLFYLVLSNIFLTDKENWGRKCLYSITEPLWQIRDANLGALNTKLIFLYLFSSHPVICVSWLNMFSAQPSSMHHL